ncbi:amidohydrolase family protein [Parahaliea aestuarii]|uniref:Amidohydrolase family protein n=1 Tax=Parahaliea aestuarii TaxID=1852021 RepID=A0A5C8ZPZ5_9GAMM|nr:amidohydrolase family protein [Parahaliea aestuarii]TXS90623.1 amidohydrolase family protein [Parahaliea aestuarii]
MPRLPRFFCYCHATALLIAAPLLVAAPDNYRYSDAHLHAVDFFQQGMPLGELIAAMDAASVGDAMISGMGLMKKWQEDEPKQPDTYAGDDAPVYWFSATDAYLAAALQGLPEAQRLRLHPFLSGFNPTDKNATLHLERMVEMYPGLWQGIGEVITRHDDLTALTEGETPRANSEAMYRVYAFARRHDLPVLLHSNITSKRERNALYAGEVEAALKKFPEVRFIWAHAGTSKTLHRFQDKLDFLHGEVERLLAAHDNLYIDLSWTVLRPYLLDGNDRPDPEWVALVTRYPGRFMLGSDLLGRYKSLGEKLTDYELFLQALPGDTARAVARDNFLAVLPEKGATGSEPFISMGSEPFISSK